MDIKPGEEDEAYMCPYINAIVCKFGECSRCKECENNPETYILNAEILKQFEEKPWGAFCMTCGEFCSIHNHPGHIIAVGYEQYREKIPEMIMDRMLRDAGEADS